jgi:hypothetical protein
MAVVLSVAVAAGSAACTSTDLAAASQRAGIPPPVWQRCLAPDAVGCSPGDVRRDYSAGASRSMTPR